MFGLATTLASLKTLRNLGRFGRNERLRPTFYATVRFNRRRDRTKILFWDRSGLCLYYKRIERGVFHLSSVASGDSPRVEIEAVELALLLEGIDLSHAKRRARFTPRKTA